MSTEQRVSLGIYNESPTARGSFQQGNAESRDSVARRLYDKSYEALKDADFMAVHCGMSKCFLIRPDGTQF